MKYIPKLLSFSAIFVVVLFFFLAPAKTEAATLFFSNGGTYNIGQTVPVTVYVASTQAMNAVSGTVSFPTDKLQLTSISKDGSILTFWTQEPSSSNATGKASFEGVVYNPGYTGPAGQIVTLYFKVKAAGSATLSFSEASVLANDGQGTNILDGTRNVTLALGEEATNITTGPQAPRIYSPTHPDPEKWYPTGDVTMKWDVPNDVTAVKILYDHFPSSQPTVLYDSPIAEKSFSVQEGVWYFHVQEKNESGWGPLSHFRFQVDLTPPHSLKADFSNSGPNGQSIVSLSAVDDVSGIDHYELKMDGVNPIEINPSDIKQGQFILPPLDPGHKNVEVRAYDKAGNSTFITTSFDATGIPAPVINPISSITENDFLQVSGTAVANADIQVIVKSGNTSDTETTKSDANGSFNIVWQKKLGTGAYSVTAQATNDHGLRSAYAKEVTFAVEQPVIFRFGMLVINYASLLFIILLILSAIIMWMWYIWHRMKTMRSRLLKKVDHADSVLRKKFASLKKSVSDEIHRLEHASSHRELTAEEDAIAHSLRKSLEDAETLLEEEIKNIRNI